ncbi:helix-turn-helix domain-containing protein [Ruminococcus flavefaciens]|uniref:helix-turn-helix domain-containing protein n=1 Tax=Ruminococcus flavefaciens TaxID=1265 RepID=UPI0026F250AB|nr:helix-turn-helix domain-containing protein [Ruminococcus flavefaciens]MDD7515862.1 helix-turn-helix domain-containing protein [Ruminococcus flavefaciens]MDY5690379.1 helix-turn-helix domain-containing protein [Ruminococcus flavefaciens]
MELKDRISKIRRMRGLTQNELAEKAGVSARAIQNYEGGTRTPKKDILAKIAEILAVDEKALASDEEYFVIEANEKYGSKGKAAAQKLVENAAALFAGGDISEEDKANVMEALQEAYWEAKITNKKYTPKKYRKNQNSDENNSEE